MKILILKGLPASGKSTYAKEVVEKNAGIWKRVNKDDLRAMLDGSRWSKTNEKFILEIRDIIIRTALHNRRNVIVDDTNLAPFHEDRIRLLAADYDGCEVEVKMFDTPLAECIERDRKRDKPVGASVIRDMYNKYLRKEIQQISRIGRLKDVVICDLDGTLALHNGRSPYDAAKCETDSLNMSLAIILSNFLSDDVPAEVIFLSGREETFREQTQRWLNKHGFSQEKLLMRPAGDKRNDTIVKQELYEQHIKDRYNVIAVFDDRARVCRMWHSLGLPLYRVGDPDAEF